MMSIKAKLQAFRSECFSELNKKKEELQSLIDKLNNLIELARKEIRAESARIEAQRRIQDRREELLNKKQIQQTREIETAREEAERRIDRHIDDVIEYFEELKNYGKDPKLIDAYINACFILDGKLSKFFRDKPRPNMNASETISAYKKENKKNLQRIKELEYQLSELWAKETDTSEKEAFEELEEDEERIRYFLTPTEYSSLSETERNQRALDNYLHRNHSKSHIGKMYERYIGYLYEQQGYKVEYHGIEWGLKDGGIDLICRRNGEILLVQCKNWSLDSTIYEKHICQLYGASRFYDRDTIQMEYSDSLFANEEWERVTPVFVSTARLDDHAIEVAKKLGVQIRHISFNKNYPIIKCNINNYGEKIYHLPIDQMYDVTMICKPGERWVSTVKEAERLGFRRAMRHRINGERRS